MINLSAPMTTKHFCPGHSLQFVLLVQRGDDIDLASLSAQDATPTCKQ
jgi:hypothetical protein